MVLTGRRARRFTGGKALVLRLALENGDFMGQKGGVERLGKCEYPRIER